MADISRLKEDLLCGICKKILNDPQLLPCDHTFCRQPCLIQYGEKPLYVSCPFCYIEVDACEIRPNTEILQRLQALNKPHYAAPTFSCTSCLQSCTKLNFCFHCDTNICQTCLDSHVCILIKIVEKKKKSLLQSRNMLAEMRYSVPTSQDKSCSEFHAELLAQIEQAVLNLQDASFEALRRAKDELDSAELRSNESLFNAFDSMKDLGQMLASLLGQTLYLRQEKDINLLSLFKDQAQSIMKSTDDVEKLLSVPHKNSMRHFGISKSFQTVGMHLQSLSLIISDNLQPLEYLQLHDYHKSSSSSSVDFESERNTFSKEDLSDAPNSDRDRIIFIGGLKNVLDKNSLSKYFSRFGVVTNVFIPNSSRRNVNRGFGFVTFSDKRAAQLALQSKSHNIELVHIDVRKFRTNYRSLPKYAVQELPVVNTNSGEVMF